MLYVTIQNFNTKRTEHLTCREIEFRPCTIPLPEYEGLSEVWIFPYEPILPNRPDAAYSVLTEYEVWIHSQKFLEERIERTHTLRENLEIDEIQDAKRRGRY